MPKESKKHTRYNVKTTKSPFLPDQPSQANVAGGILRGFFQLSDVQSRSGSIQTLWLPNRDPFAQDDSTPNSPIMTMELAGLSPFTSAGADLIIQTQPGIQGLVQRTGTYIEKLSHLLALIKRESCDISTTIHGDNMDVLDSLRVLTRVVEVHLETQTALSQLNLIFAHEFELLNSQLEETFEIPPELTRAAVVPSHSPSKIPRKKNFEKSRCVQTA